MIYQRVFTLLPSKQGSHFRSTRKTRGCTWAFENQFKPNKVQYFVVVNLQGMHFS